MFENFTLLARRILDIAQQEARGLGRLYVSNEHIVLAFLKEGRCACAQQLVRAGFSYDAALPEVKRLEEHNQPEESGGHVLYTPSAKAMLGRAISYAYARSDDRFVTTFDIVRALFQAPSARIIILIEKFNVRTKALDALCTPDANAIHAEIIATFEGTHESKLVEVAMGAPASSGTHKTRVKMLKKYGRNLVKKASEGKLDPVIGRDKEILRMVQILSRRQKNNPLILGDPGVGKTAVVEGLAQLIADKHVPDVLASKEIWSLDISSMLAGAKYRGEFEDRLKRVVSEVRANETIILFIDEIHTIIGAGSAEGSIDAASILKPPLARSEIQVIGATTAEEYRKHIEKDAALERRFQPVMVSEPSCAEALSILEGLKDHYETFHNAHYEKGALEEAVRLASRYIQDRFLPDKAIDVIDEAGARARVAQGAHTDEEKRLLGVGKRSGVAEEVDADGAALSNTDAASLADNELDESDFAQAARAIDEKRAVQVAAARKQAAAKSAARVVVTKEMIADVISDISGVPVSSLTEEESSKLLHCEEELHKHIVGQDEAVKKVSACIRRSRSPLKDPRRPGGSFMFLGPSGVGKTELAKTLAEFLFGTKDALINFDMSEYMEKHEVSKLVGAPPGYIGYTEGGELTKAVRRRPYSVVLFDEVEKAHPDVFNVLLQILEEGRLTDGQGRVVDFANTVIVMTSNIGARDIAQTAPMGFSAQDEAGLSHTEITSRVQNELKRAFRPEFINRIDEIVVFSALKKDELRKIVSMMIGDLNKRLAPHEMEIELTPSACDYIAKEGTDPIYGARPLRRSIQRLIEDKLSEEFLAHTWNKGDKINVDYREGELVFTRTKADLKKLARLREEGVNEDTLAHGNGSSSIGGAKFGAPARTSREEERALVVHGDNQDSL